MDSIEKSCNFYKDPFCRRGYRRGLSCLVHPQGCLLIGRPCHRAASCRFLA
ncbi:hypothetical protein TRIP_B40367 [uncultured Desulfatiglans sp.]|nr:hypothetical protein TRIP_B40367 [uncultured Desulfatiglans sp.]